MLGWLVLHNSAAPKWLLLYLLGPGQQVEVSLGQGNIGSLAPWGPCVPHIECVQSELCLLFSGFKQGNLCWVVRLGRGGKVQWQTLSPDLYRPDPLSGSPSICPVLSLPTCPENGSFLPLGREFKMLCSHCFCCQWGSPCHEHSHQCCLSHLCDISFLDNA